jgi:toxin ParE1/3/4
VVWTRRALGDLEAIGKYIGRDKPAAAERWLLELISVAEKAAVVPLAGRRVPELDRNDVREIFARSYRIVYRVTERRIEVLAVFEGHRLFPRDVDKVDD